MYQSCVAKVVFNHNDMGTTFILLIIQWTILLSFYTYWLLALKQPRQLSLISTKLRGRLKGNNLRVVLRIRVSIKSKEEEWSPGQARKVIIIKITILQ